MARTSLSRDAPGILSKSRYLAGFQCAKRLWYEVNARNEVPPPDPNTQAIFDQGQEVGRLAQRLYPGGIEIDRERLDWVAAAQASTDALGRRLPLYEAAFIYEGAGCRVDILVPAEDGQWDLVEIKSSSEVKDEHLADVAFQTWILRGAGIALRRSLLGHLNREYVRQGALDLSQLFALEDLSEKAVPLLGGIGSEVARLQTIAAQGEFPPVPIGPHCSKPYECPLESLCWSHIPEESVFTLYRGGRKAWDLYHAGFVELTSVPLSTKLTDRQAKQVEAARSRIPHIDRREVERFLSQLVYPVHYFDLESFALAIPPFDNVRPHQQVPFQFSLCVIDSPGAAPRAGSFLAEGGGDPRPGFLAAARAAIGSGGSIVAFNARFEKQCLIESAQVHREYETWVEDLLHRFVDLLVPFREFAYYDPGQLGSASLKAVLPVLAGRGYEGLEIQEGQAAAREFLRSLDAATPTEEGARIRSALLAYCGRDVEGMFEIVEQLGRVASAD